MTLKCINPADLPPQQTYTQVVVATGSKLVFIAVYANLGRALAAAGARPDQVARITIYVVNYERDACLPIIEAARTALFGAHKPADVVLGVTALSPGYLIEVDAIAVMD
jgi:enamine deaminase RidA (YjgF/YER057c/UK114 family)